jgi:hypothetical protein
LAAGENPVSEQREALYSKQKRQSLSDDKKNDLIYRATKLILPKADMLDLVSPSFTEEDILEDTLEVASKLSRLQSHMIDYDFIDIMTVVTIDESDPTNIKKESNLLEDYMNISPKMVALSNEWYRKHVDLKAHPWIPENLQISAEFLQNNMSEALWQAVNLSYKDYNAAQQGGPLIFVLMMHELQKNNDVCLTHLATRVKSLNISTIKGEDVSKVVNLIVGSLQ